MDRHVSFVRSPDGARIATMTWGDGPLLVVPPGWVSHLELQWALLGMEPLCARLAESFRLVFYDRRGSGLSERRRDDYTLEAEVRDLEAVLDHTTEGPVSLLGISQAGPIAVRYAARHPDRVARLVLLGTYDVGAELAPPAVRESLVALVRASWGMGARALASLFVPDDVAPSFHRGLAQFQREAAERAMAAELLDAGYRYDVRAELAAIRVPTLVLHRREDRAIRSSFALELASRIPNARLVMLEGDIHFPWLGDWSTLAERIEDFLGAEAKRSPPPAAPSRPRASSGELTPPVRVLHYRVAQAPERAAFRVALAQIGETADLPQPTASGLYRLPVSRVDAVCAKLRDTVRQAALERADLVVFPELSLDLGHAAIDDAVQTLAREHGVRIVTGGHHDEATRANVCRVIGPEGVLWQQRKHIPAVLRTGDAWIEEPIETPPAPLYVVAGTELGRIAVTICRDFLDLDARVALKNAEPAVDLVVNPAFSPVTVDFETAHFEARRALYACTVFCNFAAFGGSRFESPEKGASLHLPPQQEALRVVDVPLFALRAERLTWDERAHRRFVQSTRH
jgi:pimeloyl-ACP methyl ester carboxylesterase/predicted amidohydrolase